MRVTQERAAAIVFAVAVAAALPTILYLNRHQWFFLDEWDFLAGRDIRSIDDLLRPHNEHWTTIPIVLYRFLFRVVGLHHYWPYQLLAVTAHLSAAALLRVVMRRAGVNPWIATAAATLFVFFGAGREDIAWAFQVTFSGSLAFGLAAIVLASHDDEGFGRRDLAAMACGLGALMCSGIGVSMVAALGVTVLVARGWKLAAAYVLPLAGAYVAWFLAYGRDAVQDQHGTFQTGRDKAWNIIHATFGDLGQVRGVGILLAVLFVVGLVLAAGYRPLPELRRRYAACAGLLVAAVMFLAITGYGRSLANTTAASRYQHLLAAMVLPTIAVGASMIAARWRYALPVLVVLLLVGLPANIGHLRPQGVDLYTMGNPTLMLNLAALADSSKLPRSYHPLPDAAAAVTIGWLRDQRAFGRIPSPPAAPLIRRQLRFRLSLEQLRRAPSVPCAAATAPAAPVRLSRGDTISVPSAAAVTFSRAAANGPPDLVTFAPKHGDVVVRSVVDDLTVGVAVPLGAGPLSVCRAPR